MYVPWVSNKQKNLGEKDLLFVGVMKVIKEKSTIRIRNRIRIKSIDPRIRIRIKTTQIRNTGIFCNSLPR